MIILIQFHELTEEERKKARGRELLGKAGESKGMGSTGPHSSDAETSKHFPQRLILKV